MGTHVRLSPRRLAGAALAVGLLAACAGCGGGGGRELVPGLIVF